MKNFHRLFVAGLSLFVFTFYPLLFMWVGVKKWGWTPPAEWLVTVVAVASAGGLFLAAIMATVFSFAAVFRKEDG